MRGKLRGIALAGAVLVLLGILAQAVLAGQSWFAGADLVGLHGGVGHGVLTVSVVTAAVLWIGRARLWLAALATLVVLALIAQTGLGYVGHRTGVALASSLHIPIGVVLAAAAAAVATGIAADPRGVGPREG